MVLVWCGVLVWCVDINECCALIHEAVVTISITV